MTVPAAESPTELTCILCGSRRSMILKNDRKGRPFLQGTCCASRIFSHSRMAWRLPALWAELLDTLFPDPHDLLTFVQAAEAKSGLPVLLARIQAHAPNAAPASAPHRPIPVVPGPNATRPSA